MTTTPPTPTEEHIVESTRPSTRPPARSHQERLPSSDAPLLEVSNNRLILGGAALALLAALTFLVGDGGGVRMQWTPYVTLLLVSALPALVVEVRYWPKSVVAAFSVWTVVGLLALVYDPVRSQFPSALMVQSGIFLVAAAASYVWRRSPRTFKVILLLTSAVWAIQAVINWMTPLAPSQARVLWALGWHNPTAAFYSMLSVLAIAVALVTKRRSHVVLATLAASAATTAVYLTNSRGGYATFALGAALVVVLSRAPLRRVAIVGALSLVVCVALSSFFLAIAPAPRVGGAAPQGATTAVQHGTAFGSNASASGDFSLRVMYWKTGLRIISHYPVLGIGPGAWPDVSWHYMKPTEDWSTAAHEWYIQTGAEEGLIAMGALIVLSGVGVVAATRVRRVRHDEQRYALALGAAAAIVMELAHAAIDFDNRWPVVMWLLAALAGLLAASFPVRSKINVGRFITLISVVVLSGTLLMSVVAGAESSNVLGSPLGRNAAYSIPHTESVVQYLLDYKDKHGHSAPLAGTAIDYVNASLKFNPNNQRLILLRESLLFRVQEISATKYYHDVTHQSPNPWIQAYIDAAAAFGNRRYPFAQYAIAHAGLKILSANPGWDGSGGSTVELLTFEMQALNRSYPCNEARLGPLLDQQRHYMKTATADVAHAAMTFRYSVAQACPNLAARARPYVKR